MSEVYDVLLASHVTDAEVRRRLARYLSLLEHWARTHNLVAATTPEELVGRHVLEALAGVEALPARPGLLVDVGSGAGLPGVPLLCAASHWRGVLVEPRQKRWTFLRLVIRELGLSAEAVRMRFQDLPGDVKEISVVCARALGRHDELLRWAKPRLASGGKVVLWTTVEGCEALARVADWRVVSSPLPGLASGRLAELQPCFT
ncbi:MAG: 16S rRNA (guanine(527)-N(7))-methyltransferase RsmG [Acidobacteria bacterium]|nr:16S rRNA (guanine(527)-N(7))-methyltransferase RsmG [Acidobacteriota bacterium]